MKAASDSPIPLAVPNVGAREAELVQQCFTDNWVSTVGPFVEQLESKVAAISGVPHGVAVAAGTMGLHAALTAVGVGRGDVVILPTYTFIGSANAISHAGARPWLFDITDRDWTLDPDDLTIALHKSCARDGSGALRLNATGERVAAIMPVYTLGTPADMDRILPLAKNFGLPIIADAAAALGALYKNRPIGTLADLTVFSFNGNKTITTGGGGMIVGADDALMKTVKHITTTARVGADYDHDRVGFNYRMTNLEAAMGCAQIEKLELFLAAKERIRRVYDEAFANHPKVTSFPSADWAKNAHWLSGVVLRRGADISVDWLVQALRGAGITARKFWKPMHMQAPYRDAPTRATPVSDALWECVLTLPCSTSLTPDQQKRVIEALRSFVN
jgi:perosamine synthetase